VSEIELESVHPDDVPADAIILDVRSDEEWSAGHIAGAVHVPMEQLQERMLNAPGELATDKPLVLTCRGGGRAGRAASWLNANGFEAVLLDGSMRGWEAAGKPMVSENGEDPIVG
jgi:rhodanese-related sulfurtransferase